MSDPAEQHQRIILTISQARALQRAAEAWPAEWAAILAIPIPERSDTISDPDRVVGGLTMLAWGCGDEQIAQQMNWKSPSAPLRQLHRLNKCEPKDYK